MADFLASDWSSDVRSHVVWETADQLVKRDRGLTGSDRKSQDRKSRHLNRKSCDLEGETADEYEKGIVGSRGRKTVEKSPKSNWGNGGDR